MKIKLIVIGKTDKSFLTEGEQTYLKRLSHYLPVERIEIPEIKNAKKLTIEQIKKKEGEAILNKLNSSDRILLLDEKGKEFTSEAFANFLQKQFNQGGSVIAFIIGGAYGFSPEIYAAAEQKIALSKMTFSHQMVRMFFVEQLYRAMTILRNEPYHHS